MATDTRPDASLAFTRALLNARAEARAFDQAPIDTGHLLLGLVAEPWSDAGRILAHVAVSAAVVRPQVADRGPRREGPPDELSDEAAVVLRYARREATALGHRQLGTVHLLLGILWHERCFGAQILDRLVGLGAIDHLIVERLQEGGELPSVAVAV